MDNQTTAPEVQSEQPTDVAQQTEATPAVQETVLAEAETKETSFKDLIPKDYQEEKALQNFNSMEDFVKSYLSAQRLVGANKIAVPNKMATDEDWQQVFQKLGAPNKPEDYKYSFSNEDIDQNMLSSFNETAHRLGLLPQQAERLIKFYNEMNTDAEQAKVQAAELNF